MSDTPNELDEIEHMLIEPTGRTHYKFVDWLEQFHSGKPEVHHVPTSESGRFVDGESFKNDLIQRLRVGSIVVSNHVGSIDVVRNLRGILAVLGPDQFEKVLGQGKKIYVPIGIKHYPTDEPKSLSERLKLEFYSFLTNNYGIQWVPLVQSGREQDLHSLIKDQSLPEKKSCVYPRVKKNSSSS